MKKNSFNKISALLLSVLLFAGCSVTSGTAEASTEEKEPFVPTAQSTWGELVRHFEPERYNMFSADVREKLGRLPLEDPMEKIGNSYDSIKDMTWGEIMRRYYAEEYEKLSQAQKEKVDSLLFSDDILGVTVCSFLDPDFKDSGFIPTNKTTIGEMMRHFEPEKYNSLSDEQKKVMDTTPLMDDHAPKGSCGIVFVKDE